MFSRFSGINVIENSLKNLRVLLIQKHNVFLNIETYSFIYQYLSPIHRRANHTGINRNLKINLHTTQEITEHRTNHDKYK